MLLRLDHYTSKPYADLVEESRKYYEGLTVAAGLGVAPAPDSPLAQAPAPAPVSRPADAATVPKSDYCSCPWP